LNHNLSPPFLVAKSRHKSLIQTITLNQSDGLFKLHKKKKSTNCVWKSVCKLSNKSGHDSDKRVPFNEDTVLRLWSEVYARIGNFILIKILIGTKPYLRTKKCIELIDSFQVQKPLLDMLLYSWKKKLEKIVGKLFLKAIKTKLYKKFQTNRLKLWRRTNGIAIYVLQIFVKYITSIINSTVLGLLWYRTKFTQADIWKQYRTH